MSDYIEPTAEERRARLKQLEKEEEDERARRQAASRAATPPRNPNYDANGDLILPTPKPRVVIPPPTAEEVIAQEAARLGPRPSVNPKPVGDPLLNREPEYVQRAQDYTPPKLKTSITLQPHPDKYPPSDPRHGMPEELILRMGMKP